MNAWAGSDSTLLRRRTMLHGCRSGKSFTFRMTISPRSTESPREWREDGEPHATDDQFADNLVAGGENGHSVPVRSFPGNGRSHGGSDPASPQQERLAAKVGEFHALAGG